MTIPMRANSIPAEAHVTESRDAPHLLHVVAVDGLCVCGERAGRKLPFVNPKTVPVEATYADDWCVACAVELRKWRLA